jgi:hypothetical protein
MTIKERVGDGFQEQKIRKTFADSYTLEMLAFHDCAINGKTTKTSVKDSRRDIELFEMIMQAGSDRYR